MTAERRRASIAWTRPSRNDCSSRAAWYSDVLLEVAVLLGRPDPGDDLRAADQRQLVELGAQAGRAVGGQRLGHVARPSRGHVGSAGDRPWSGVARRRSWGRRPDVSARAVRHVRPRRRRRARRRHVSAASGASTTSASSEPVRPVALRSPVAVRRLAHGSTTVRSGRAARSAAGTPSANAASRASSYSSVASVGAHQTRRPSSDRRVLSQWPAGYGRRSPELGPGDRRHTSSDRRLRCPDVEDRLRRQPERGEARGERPRGRSLAVETQRLDPLDPFPDAGQLDRRGRPAAPPAR